MIFVKGLKDIPSNLKSPSITIGNFDGVHLGHQALFKKTIECARLQEGDSIAITFHPHPIRVLRPEIPLKLICDLEQKIEWISEQGIDILVCIPFTKKFASTSATNFVKDILVEKLKVSNLIVGYDYSFGRNREGNINFLKAQGALYHFNVHVVSPVVVDSLIVSSTLIRELVSEGKIEVAFKMLGRPFELKGEVVEGARRGGPLLGFPTANILVREDQLCPKVGVYAVIVNVECKEYEGVLNVGYNPTFGGEQLSAEVHIFDFSQDIYGKIIRIKLIKRLRDEKNFSSPKALINQIQKDILNAKMAISNFLKCGKPL